MGPFRDQRMMSCVSLAQTSDNGSQMSEKNDHFVRLKMHPPLSFETAFFPVICEGEQIISGTAYTISDTFQVAVDGSLLLLNWLTG